MRLLIVDDHAVVRIGLRALLEAEEDVTVVGEAGTVAESVAQAEVLRPDVILMDVRLPDGSGVDACRTIRVRAPAARVLMLTSFADDDLVLDAIDAGAAGYVLKRLDTDELVRAIRAVARGESYMDPAVTRMLVDRVRRSTGAGPAGPFDALSKREIEVLARVAEGRTNAEIAADLFLSEKTVRNHVSAILDRLDFTNRTEAAAYAIRHRIDRYGPKPPPEG